MKKSRKLVYLLVLLMLILLSGTLILAYYKVAPSNFNFSGEMYEEAHHFITANAYWQQFAFWMAIVLGVIAIITFILVLFYPRQIDAYNFRDKKGKSTLSISRKAIEGIVRSSLSEQDLLANPKIKLNVRKRKLKIAVKGNLTNTAVDLVELEGRWAEKLRQDLNALLGVEQKKKIKVRIVNTDHAHKKANGKRKAPKNTRVV